MLKIIYLIKRKKITKGSYKDTKSKYNNHIKPYLGDKLAEEITVEDIDQITEDKEDILAPKTINMLVELIGTIYNFAIEQKKVQR
ncbi:hypothetical protein [Sulfurospirillum diekertiae]|uniref:hypothetical protein n=1 Tax=Sulfurospirillum diekertiae TaxID=1854492 RepID=UPI000B4CAD53